ncbi:MAG: amidase family protein, partial [Pseudomonadota bacterium]|nr:amidase family protein [Pseudomonadota bacterium]
MVKHTFKTITEQAKDIEENRLSPLTLLEEYFYNISKQHKPENIFTEVFKENALKEASDSQKRQRSGLRKSPLDGIPINWKDLFDIEGKACEGGSLLLAGRISKKDADIVVNASNCGLINLGKTHLSELAFSGLGVNPKTATPPNSSKKEIAPGGSSSGAAVATALYLSSAGIGSDTGGSVRIPAAWNNLVGFKPTHGNLSLNGALQLCPSFDTAGPITRTVQDSCYLYDALRGEKLKVIEESNLNEKKFLVDRSFLTKDLSPEVNRSFEV